MLKIVVLGGSFNPPHNGHLRILKTAAKYVGADISLMIPTFSPPHKGTSALAPAKDRYNMCELCAPLIGAEASDIELVRGGKSYTVDTLLALREKYGECKVYLAMGADMLVTLKQWHRYDEIILLSEIIAVVRSDTQNREFFAAADSIRADGGKVTLLNLPADGISSSSVRDKLRRGESAAAYVPADVLDYINKNLLYL